jgi:hypothetical protein
MSFLINNELIWLSIPKNASYSIESSLKNSSLNIKPIERYGQYKKYTSNNNELIRHMHFNLKSCIEEFGSHKTICIKRDYADRWVSGLSQLYKELHLRGSNFRIRFEDIDNKIIYDLFDKSVIQNINTCEEENQLNFLRKLVTNDLKNVELKNFRFLWTLLVSQNYWKSNKICTYEFDINELDKFQNFIKNRYDTDIAIPKLNSTNNSIFKKNKVILDEKLKNWIWENFEVPFVKSNKLI